MSDHTRLPAPWGSRIDRSRSVTFRFDGKTFTGHPGDTVASALLAQGQWVLSRSFKYHRPRGPMTMAGTDANTLVQIGPEPNVRADLRALERGMDIRAQNTSHSADRDLNSVLDRFGRFMPVGFYYRTFFGPGRNSWRRLWEPIIRRSAGLGKLDPTQAPAVYAKRNLACDVLVVGAGAAGMAAARNAAEAGADVVIVDSEPETGGALTYGGHSPDHLAQARRGLETAGVRVLTGATCNGWYADNFLPVLQSHVLWRVRAAQVILATGTQEQPLVFRNNDLPGIVTAGGAQRLMRHHGVRPGRRAVVFAGTPHGVQAAHDLADAGVTVAAVLVPPGTTLPASLRQTLVLRGLRVETGATVVAAQGKNHLRALVVDIPAGRQTLDCDVAVIDAGATPGYQLALHAGAKLGFDDARQSFALSGLPDAVRLAGSVAGHLAMQAVVRSGEIAGAEAARALGLLVDIPDPLPDPDAAYHRTWPVPAPSEAGRDFVDLDEDLQVKDIVNAVADGYRDLELVKRYSTVGMGPSQGRHSALATARIVAAETGRSVGEIGITTARPPFGPEKLGLLAGPLREPYRLTALHDWHRAAGAAMVAAGNWWRPLHYAGKADPATTIADEVRLVRDGAGMLDVSTLGKIMLRGPDAGAFLDRIYTMAHAGQPVGRVRYCLMLNDMGSVIDDGVAFREGQDSFYVTATTGAVDRVFAEMSLQNAQWRMQVDIQNVTSAFAAINLTGPSARAVLERLGGDIALGASDFAFLDGRRGTIGGHPVRALRIGFTGEVSFELHTPRSHGLALWQALLAAGARPYGLEASRILRLEKGHIIIGQDTDALTTPDELDMGWALSKKKPYFIGKPALERRRDLGLTRRLCRFVLPEGAGRDMGESCLVLRDGSPAGYVTSIACSPTLGQVIGLAYAHPADAVPGGRIRLRDRKGAEHEARLVEHAFVDPDNTRQEM